MAALKTRITPARRRPPRRIPASAAVPMGETITLRRLELGGASVAPPRPPARSAGVNPAPLAALSVVLLAAGGALPRRLRARRRTDFRRPLGARRRLRLCARRLFRPAPLGPAPHLPAVGRGSRALPLAFGPAQGPEKRPHHLAVGALAGRWRLALLRAGPADGHRARGGRPHVGGMGALDALAASERSRGHHTFRRRRHRALRRGGHPLLVTGTRAAALRLPLPLRLVLLAGKRRGNRVPGIAAQLGDRVAGAGLGADAARHCALGLAQLHLAGQADARRVHYPDVAREVDGPIDPPPAQVAGAHVGPAHEGPGIDRGRRVAASHRPATVATVVDERGPIAIAEGAPTHVARTDRPRHPR